MVNEHQPATYLFGHSDHETRRLQLQAQLFGAATRRMLLEAGITPGMRVLDVGSGAGDVALLLAELIGHQGQVLGIDSNAAILVTARARAAKAGLTNVSFPSGDVGSIDLGAGFDAAVGRCVLFFVPDPVSVLRRVAAAVRPGGIVAFQEPGNEAHPPVADLPSPLLNQMWAWIMALYRATGMDQYSGMHPFRFFQDAGLPPPTMHLDAAVGGGPDWLGYEYMASLVRTLLPHLEAAGVATAATVDIETFANRLRAEVVRSGGAATTWSFITAWAHAR